MPLPCCARLATSLSALQHHAAGCAMLLCCPLLCCIFCVLGHKTQSISNRVKYGDTCIHRVCLALYSVYTGTCLRTCTMHMSAVNNPVPQRYVCALSRPGLTVFSNSLLKPVSSKQSSQYSLVSTVFSMISKSLLKPSSQQQSSPYSPLTTQSLSSQNTFFKTILREKKET